MMTNREPGGQPRGVDASHCRTPRKAVDSWADDGGSAAPARKSAGDHAANTPRADVRKTNAEQGRVTMTVELTADQVRALRDLLETQISDLGPEIHHTRTPDYRETLKTLRESFKALDRELAGVGS